MEKTDLPASAMKLIHSGKVLKDADTIESCNIKPNAFLVVMIAKVSGEHWKDKLRLLMRNQYILIFTPESLLFT